MTLYDSLAGTKGGRGRLAAAHLRRSALKSLRAGLSQSGITQTELAQRLGVRKSAVGAVFNGAGNIQLNTLSEYLDAMGLEAEISWAPAGTARKKRLERRDAAGYQLDIVVPTRQPRTEHLNLGEFHTDPPLEPTMRIAWDRQRTDFAMAA